MKELLNIPHIYCYGIFAATNLVYLCIIIRQSIKNKGKSERTIEAVKECIEQKSKVAELQTEVVEEKRHRKATLTQLENSLKMVEIFANITDSIVGFDSLPNGRYRFWGFDNEYAYLSDTANKYFLVSVNRDLSDFLEIGQTCVKENNGLYHECQPFYEQHTKNPQQELKIAAV